MPLIIIIEGDFMSNYVLSQLLVIVSTIFIGASYLAKSKKRVMLLCVVYCIFYSSHYMLLGAYTGMVMSLISACRNIYFYYYAKRNKRNNYFSLIFFMMFAFISGIIFYQDYISIVSMSANMLSTYSIWQDNVVKYRILAIPVSLGFIIYAIHISSIFSLIMELFLLGIELIGVFSLKYSCCKNKVGDDLT